MPSAHCVLHFVLLAMSKQNELLFTITSICVSYEAQTGGVLSVSFLLIAWPSSPAIANCILVIATFPDLQPPKIFFKIARGKLPRRNKRHSSWAYKHASIRTMLFSCLYEVYYSLRKYLYITYTCYLRRCTVHVDNIKFFICSTNAHNSYKIVKLLKSFKITIVAPACFSSHKPSSGSSQPVFR